MPCGRGDRPRGVLLGTEPVHVVEHLHRFHVIRLARRRARRLRAAAASRSPAPGDCRCVRAPGRTACRTCRPTACRRPLSRPQYASPACRRSVQRPPPPKSKSQREHRGHEAIRPLMLPPEYNVQRLFGARTHTSRTIESCQSTICFMNRLNRVKQERTPT
jgi:hypothetical protein